MLDASSEAYSDEGSPAIRNMGTQTEIIPRDFIPLKVLRLFMPESEAFPSFLYKSHTLFLMGMLILFIIYQAFFKTEALSENSFITNSRRGYIIACLAVIL